MQKTLDAAVASERFHVGNLGKALWPHLEADKTLGPLLRKTRAQLPEKLFGSVYHALIRACFLGEFVKHPKIETTKFDVRWTKRLGPGDPRRASFIDCLTLFRDLVADLVSSLAMPKRTSELRLLVEHPLLPYELPIDYKVRVTTSQPIHRPGNVVWVWDDPLVASAIKLRSAVMDPEIVGKAEAVLFEKALSNKIKVKTYLTDRVLTGDHKTNREKRWEVHPLSVHFALRRDCLGIERELVEQLCHFEGFPDAAREKLRAMKLIANREPTRCPVTLTPFSYKGFCEEIASPVAGKSNFQVGHLRPLKQAPTSAATGHTAANIAWISADGNRIQGSLSLENTRQMLRAIAKRYEKRGWD